MLIKHTKLCMSSFPAQSLSSKGGGNDPTGCDPTNIAKYIYIKHTHKNKISKNTKTTDDSILLATKIKQKKCTETPHKCIHTKN